MKRITEIQTDQFSNHKLEWLNDFIKNSENVPNIKLLMQIIYRGVK